MQKKINLGQILEIVASLGVIAGIVFLGYELRQNNELLVAESRFNVAAVRDDWWDRLSDPQIAQLITKAQLEETLTAAEKFQLFALYQKLMATYEWNFLEGTLGSSTIQLNSLRAAFRNNPQTMREALPGLRQHWNNVKLNSFSPEFIQFMDENIVVDE